MSKYHIDKIVNTFSALGDILRHPDAELSNIINNQLHYNAWFTPENVARSVISIGKMLNHADMTEWLSHYQLNEGEPKRVGLILAGNIPLVGFHDVLCVLASGNSALIKLSSQDNRLIKYVLQKLAELDPELAGRFTYVEKLEGFDAVIATGSNNTSRYFEHYFGKVPNIIRRNRNSIAVLTGSETTEQLHALGHDIFDYYGLGCRNVSKILVPEGYNFNHFFESIQDYEAIIHHHKYNNNYDYNKSIYLVNGDQHLDNGFLLLKKDEKLTSPLSVLFYDTYTDLQQAQQSINEQSDNIQCVVSEAKLDIKNQVVDFGESQEPKLWDYADGVDTMKFLCELGVR
jgi:hypothetical protein